MRICILFSGETLTKQLTVLRAINAKYDIFQEVIIIDQGNIDATTRSYLDRMEIKNLHLHSGGEFLHTVRHSQYAVCVTDADGVTLANITGMLQRDGTVSWRPFSSIAKFIDEKVMQNNKNW
ncbi:MAG: hypothetical protein ACOC32_02325 [Nanoarchaeota archaeon]